MKPETEQYLEKVFKGLGAFDCVFAIALSWFYNDQPYFSSYKQPIADIGMIVILLLGFEVLCIIFFIERSKGLRERTGKDKAFFKLTADSFFVSMFGALLVSVGVVLAQYDSRLIYLFMIGVLLIVSSILSMLVNGFDISHGRY